MNPQPRKRRIPAVEPLESRWLLSASTAAHAAAVQRTAAANSSATAAQPQTHTASAPGSSQTASAAPADVKPNHGFLVYRITNPNKFNSRLVPPFGHVLVQTQQPVIGQTYNILCITVRNGTAQTIDASSGFRVKVSGQSQSVPILTGTEQWKPGQNYIFYILTKKYYPLRSQVSSGFSFDLGGARSVSIPGPSGIFLRIKYDPATINKILNYAITQGPGAQGGAGIRFGLPDSAINEILSAQTNRNDFGGYF